MTAVPAPDSGPDAGAIWHYGDPLGEQRAAQTDPVLSDRSHRAVLTLTGKDRQTWMHTISTQHVSELPEGASTQNLSLDGQGRVEDHWIQTELGGTTYLDTEPWRGEPLLEYLRKMGFWSEGTPDGADMGVLSLVGPRGEGGDGQTRRPQAGVRPAGVWAYEAHRVAALRARLGVDTDERTIPHEVGWIGGPGAGAVHLDKGCYRGQETVARVHNLGRPPRMLVLLHLDGSVERPATGDAVLAGGRVVGRRRTVVEHVDLGPVALALLKRGLPADTELATGDQAAVAAVIDPDSLPPAEQIGAGRLAVERLRGGTR